MDNISSDSGPHVAKVCVILFGAHTAAPCGRTKLCQELQLCSPDRLQQVYISDYKYLCPTGVWAVFIVS
jgi:hypothetical protein